MRWFKNNWPVKPKSQKEQIDTLWDMVCNHILSRLWWQDKKMTFILVLNGLMLALLAILVVCLFKVVF